MWTIYKGPSSPNACPPDCKERNAYCHINCEKYAKLRSEIEAKKAAKEKEMIVEDVLYKGRARMAKAYGKLNKFKGERGE